MVSLDCVKGKLVVTYVGLILVGKIAQIGVNNISLYDKLLVVLQIPGFSRDFFFNLSFGRFR